MHNENIKILRLNDGEDIITDFYVEPENNMIVMNNPMALFFKRLSVGKSMVIMQPWLPIELVGVNSAKILANQILTVIEPKSSLVEYYRNMVEDANDMVTRYGDQMDEALLDDSSEEFEDEYTEEDAFIDQMQSSNTKNKTIH